MVQTHRAEIGKLIAALKQKKAKAGAGLSDIDDDRKIIM
jgi:hypothetical protein